MICAILQLDVDENGNDCPVGINPAAVASLVVVTHNRTAIHLINGQEFRVAGDIRTIAMWLSTRVDQFIPPEVRQ